MRIHPEENRGTGDQLDRTGIRGRKAGRADGRRASWARRNAIKRRSNQRGLVQLEHRGLRRQGRPPGHAEQRLGRRGQAVRLDFLTHKWSRVAARMDMVIIGPGKPILIVGVLVGRPVIMIMATALGGFTGAMGMIQRKHAAAESGDHAEHQEP